MIVNELVTQARCRLSTGNGTSPGTSEWSRRVMGSVSRCPTGETQRAARDWKRVASHLVAQHRGRDVWYRDYRVRVATVTRDYGPSESELT